MDNPSPSATASNTAPSAASSSTATALSSNSSTNTNMHLQSTTNTASSAIQHHLHHQHQHQTTGTSSNSNHTNTANNSSNNNNQSQSHNPTTNLNSNNPNLSSASALHHRQQQQQHCNQMLQGHSIPSASQISTPQIPIPTSLNQSNLPNLQKIKARPGYLPPDINEHPEVEIAYSDVRTIGNGSFGVVFQATLQRPTQEQIAIKKVLQDKRFKNRELQIMRKLDHCNVVKLKYFFHSNGGPGSSEVFLHLVLEYIPETLYKIARIHTRNKQNLPMLLVKLYMYQLFRSLNYIHSMDICHRDIKPQNLLLNPETGVLKLCDFGSAKSLVSGEPNVAYICSRYYRAPELIFGATDYTTKIDIWSAGCVMAELILGETMFPGGNPVDQLVEIIKILGTPSREELKAMNPNYTEFKFPVIKARSWLRILGCPGKVPTEAALLVASLLEYTPSQRLSPLEACAHSFFYELRSSPTQRLANGREFPPLFNFTSEELKREPHLTNKLMPCSSTSSTSSLDSVGGGSETTSGTAVASTSNINNSNIISSSPATHQIMTSNSNNLINDETSSSNVSGAPRQPSNSHQQQQSSQAHHGSKSSNAV